MKSSLSLQTGLWFGLAFHFIHVVNAVGASGSLSSQYVKRDTNDTEIAACQALNSTTKESSDSGVYFVALDSDNSHWMTSSDQASTCIYTPATPNDLALAIKLVGSQRIRFAVSCSNHASNQGFSSTPGIHISLHRFNTVTVAEDKTYLDIGGGLSWADVYSKVEASGVNTVGGRVAGPGIGGFITGGGGFSWKTNQHGLSGDNVISIDIVLPNGTITTASEEENSDLWWAVRGGGNRFGVIYNFRMNAYPQSPTVYAGLAYFNTDDFDAAYDGVYQFASENTDPLAQIIPTLNYVSGSLDLIVLGVYDGVPPAGTNPFGMFNTTAFSNTTFSSFVGLVQASVQAGNRGAFHSVNVQEISAAVLEQVKNQTEYYGQLGASHSTKFISYDVEPFLPYSQYTKDAAYPHSNDPLPINLYFAWTDEADDDFWHQAMIDSAAVIAETARDECQDLDELWIYPNYALANTPPSEMFGPNLEKLEQVRQKYDPDGVMLLTTYFNFS